MAFQTPPLSGLMQSCYVRLSYITDLEAKNKDMI